MLQHQFSELIQFYRFQKNILSALFTFYLPRVNMGERSIVDKVINKLLLMIANKIENSLQ